MCDIHDHGIRYTVIFGIQCSSVVWRTEREYKRAHIHSLEVKMVSYCTAAEVRAIINTNLTDEQIISIIETSDAEIDRRIGAQDPEDKLVKKLSILLTAHIIKTRQPRSQAIGDYKEDAGNVLEIWEREIERIYRLHKGISIKASDYRHIDEEKRYQEV